MHAFLWYVYSYICTCELSICILWLNQRRQLIGKYWWRKRQSLINVVTAKNTRMDVVGELEMSRTTKSEAWQVLNRCTTNSTTNTNKQTDRQAGRQAHYAEGKATDTLIHACKQNDTGTHTLTHTGTDIDTNRHTVTYRHRHLHILYRNTYVQAHSDKYGRRHTYT